MKFRKSGLQIFFPKWGGGHLIIRVVLYSDQHGMRQFERDNGNDHSYTTGLFYYYVGPTLRRLATFMLNTTTPHCSE